jgi:hypothetical protein
VWEIKLKSAGFKYLVVLGLNLYICHHVRIFGNQGGWANDVSNTTKIVLSLSATFLDYTFLVHFTTLFTTLFQYTL